MSYFKPITLASLQYWAPDHTKLLADEPNISKICEEIVSLRAQINIENDSAPALSCRNLWAALRDACQCIGHDSTELRQSVLTQIEKIRPIIRLFSAEFGTTSENFINLCDQLQGLMLSTGFGVGKRNLLRARLIKYRGFNGEVVVVARTAAAIPSLKKFLKDEAFDATVVGIDTKLDSSVRRIIVLPSWPGSRGMARLLNKGGAQKYVIIGYSHELKWADGFFSDLHDLEGIDLLTPQEKSLAVGLKPEEWPVAEKPDTPEDIKTISNMASQLARVRKGREGAEQGGSEECVPAYYCDFSGDTYAYLTGSYSATVVSLLSGAVKISEVNRVKDLCDGDVLLIRGQSERSVIATIADTINPNASLLRKQARLWHNSITTHFNSAISLHRRLKNDGLKISYQTALNWYNGTLAIAPDEENLRQLLAVLNDDNLAEPVDTIVDAKHELERLHIEAGGLITTQLYKALSDNGDLLAGADTLITIPGLGQIHIVTIESIEHIPESIPRSKTNKLLT